MKKKPVRYSAHLIARLELRNINSNVPIQILNAADNIYEDTATGYSVAIAKVSYRGSLHLMAAVFEDNDEETVVITVHPLSEKDINVKIKNGRWIK